MKTIFLSIFFVSILSALVIYFVISMERFWELTSGNPDLGPVDFETLKKTDKPNQYLVCPENYCSDQSDRVADSYEIPAEELFTIVKELIEEDKKAKLMDASQSELTLRFLTHSPIMRFPDTTNIKIVELPNGSSTFAIYAQAKLGTSDLGANKTRIDAFIDKIEAKIGES